jgi:Rieske Fe-S protein
VRTHPRTVATLLLSLLAGPVVLAGCADPDTQESSSATLTPADSSAATETTETSGVASAEPGDTSAPPFPANADPDTGEASSGASVTVSDIRIGRQDGYDRVVFEVGGTGTPGWDVRYVDAPASQGSGKPIDVAGEAALQVTITGAGYPYDTGVDEFSSDAPVTGAGTETVTEVAFDATFEGTTVAFVGTRSQAPFRVYLLENPTRVVVDVADA